MVKIEHKRDVAISADVVWEEMRHYDRVLNWIPRGDESTITVTGEGVGAIRDIQLATMGFVQHKLEAYDDAARMFSYSLTDGKPLGMKEYAVVATVTPTGPESCTIRWAWQMIGDGSADENAIGGALEQALANMTTGIIAVLKGETPDFASQPFVDD